MKWIIDYIINGGARRSVRISRDHLPGLTPPKPAPFRPPQLQDVPPQKPSINDYYRRFLSSDDSKPKTHKPKRMDK